MEKEIRTFAAIRIETGEKLRDQFRKFKTLFSDERINWVPEDNFHLTLRFIGNTSPDQLKSLVSNLEQATSNIRPFRLNIRGTGYFKSKGSPRVLFVKIDDSIELQQVAKAVEAAVVAAGFHEELKPFRPHLTLGRIKNLNRHTRFMSIVDDTPEESYQQFTVSEIILYESMLRPEGPIYKAIQKFNLL